MVANIQFRAIRYHKQMSSSRQRVIAYLITPQFNIRELFFSMTVVFAQGRLDRQESRAVARKPRDAAAVLFGLKFADNIHCKFKSQASKARLHSSKHTGTKQNLRQMAIQGHSKSRVLESVERR